MTDNILAHLNEEQQEAVTHFKGPLLILAGAGSGKTRTIIYRIAYLVSHYGVNPSTILALTFTNKAANEMVERLRRFPKGDYIKNVLATTFHSFGFMFIKENQKAASTGELQIIDEDDQLRLIAELLILLNIDKDEIPPKKIKAVINDWKNKGIDLKDYINQYFFANYLSERYHAIITKYEEIKKERGFLDFGDLLYVTYEILNNNKEILKKYEERFPFVLVDEYQDTNLIQYKILKLLCINNRNLTVVGDDDQSIYSFRGAEISNILDFKKDFPEAKIIHLSKNYRSTKNIIDVANHIISRNKERMRKELFAVNGCGEKVCLLENLDEKDEANKVLKLIKRLLQAGYDYKNIAIFYRTNHLSRRYEDMLRREKLPYRIYGSIRFYHRREIRDMLAFIRFMLNPNDVLSFQRVAGYALEGVGKQTLNKIMSQQKNSGGLIQAMEDFIASSPKNTKITLALKSFLANISRLKEEMNNLNPYQFIDCIMDITSYAEQLKKDVKDEKELDERLKNIEELKIALAENAREGRSYMDFINEIVIEDLNRKENPNVITLMTVHSAKGLEFPVVFVTALEDDIFPHLLSKQEYNVEEERRLFYVAVTRAKERLFLSYVRERNGKIQKPSPFLNEIPEEYLYNEKEHVKYSEPDHLEKNRDDVSSNRVFHKQFGWGKVLKMVSEGNDPLYLVRFDTGVEKRILSSFLSRGG